jgi:hypothetical protein
MLCKRSNERGSLEIVLRLAIQTTLSMLATEASNEEELQSLSIKLANINN